MRVIISLIVIVSNLLLANCISGNCIEGMGTMVYPDGSKYVGQYQFGLQNGEGTLYYASGDKYTGEWQNTYKHGRGTTFWANGDKYIGKWEYGKREGKGTYYWANGDSEEQFYHDGKKVSQNYNSATTNSKETSFSESSSAQTWSSIDYEELYKLISGNTLISKNKLFCSRNSSKDSCLKIAVLEPSKSFHIGRVKATVILPDKKKIIDDEWGYYAVNAFHIGIHTGITKIPTNSSQYRWDDIVKMNSEKNMIKISNGNIEILISIQQGQNKKLIANARNGNYKKFDYTGSMTIGQALVGKAIEKVGESLAKVGKNSSSTKNKSYCYGSGVSGGRNKNMCLASATGDKSYCFGSGVSDGRDRNMCLASATGDKSYCFGSGVSNGRDRNMCLASATKDKSYCFGSGINDGRDKNMCLASATGDRSYCFGSGVSDGRDRNMCLAQTR